MFSLLTQHDDFVSNVLGRFGASSEWSDAQLSAMTTIVADFLADLGVSDAYAIRFAAREAFIQLAARDSSVLEGARFLGVPISRKTPASVTVRLTNNSDSVEYINKWDAFDVGSASAYTTSSAVIQPHESLELDLTIGSVQVKNFSLASASPYMSVLVGIDNFQVCYLEVWTEAANGGVVKYASTDASLCDVAVGEKVYLDRTTATGDVELVFGGQLWGSVPDATHTLKVRVCTTQGAADNLEFLGQKVSSQISGTLQGKTVSYVLGGANEVDVDFYAKFAPVLSLSKKKASREIEWRANILRYSGVADCVVLGQRDIAPNDPSWQGVIRVCVLPKESSSWGGVNPNPRSAAWSKFLEYLNTFRSDLTIQTWNPSKLLIDVHIEASVFLDVDIASMKSTLMDAVAELFARKRGVLGRRLALNDILDALRFESDKRTRRAGLDYCNVLSPTQDIVPNSKLEYVAIRNLVINIKQSEREA